MPAAVDLTGRQFGRLTILDLYSKGKAPGIARRWRCQCSCGAIAYVRSNLLVRGDTRSCGCLQKEEVSQRMGTHRSTHTAAYSRWLGMMTRCNNAKRQFWKDYGGRGIKVCERWHDFTLFRLDMGEPPKGGTLDRIDNDGDYSPENCRWATRSQQALNKRNTRYLTYQGRTQTVPAWADELGIRIGRIRYRLWLGESDEMALRPVDKRFSHPWSERRRNGRSIRKKVS